MRKRGSWLAIPFFLIAHACCQQSSIPQIVVTDKPGEFPDSLTIPPSFFSSLLKVYWDTVYFRVACGAKKNPSKAAISDEIVNARVKVAKCSELLRNEVMILLTNTNPAVAYPRRLQGMPVNNVKDGKSITIREASVATELVTSCCSPTDCPTQCIDASQANQDCVLEVYALALTKDYRNIKSYSLEWYGQKVAGTQTSTDPEESLIYQLLLRVKCKYCFLTNCVTECKNGQFSSAYSDYNQFGLQSVNLACRPCESGTWNTCVNMASSECAWRIPSNAQDRNVGLSIAPIQGGPVQRCFPCSAIRTYPAHYPGTSKQTTIDLSFAWRCPGGGDAPVQCPNRQFVQSEDGAECVCQPGYYPVNSTYCTPCPKGYHCAKGKKEQCPKHYYQQNEGATQCLTCVPTATDDGFFRCVQSGMLLRMCDPAVKDSQTQDLALQCVPCNQCSRPFLGNSLSDPNLYDCYRDK